MQQLLAIAYIAARWARDVVWAIQRPHLRGVRVVVVDRHGAVLLVRHRAGPHAWVIPGGGIDAGEAGHVAASREIFEESGLHVPVTAHDLHGSFGEAHPRHPCTTVVYAVQLTQVLVPQPSPWSLEIAAARFVPRDQLASLDDSVEPGCLRRIHEVCAAQPAATNW